MRWKGFIEPDTKKCAASGTLSIMFSIPSCCPMVTACLRNRLNRLFYLAACGLPFVHQGRLLVKLVVDFSRTLWPIKSGESHSDGRLWLCKPYGQSCEGYNGYNGYNGYSRYLVRHHPGQSSQKDRVPSTGLQTHVCKVPCAMFKPFKESTEIFTPKLSQ